jgi:hypothetical protein
MVPILMQTVSSTVLAAVSFALVDVLLDGAQAGFVIGIAVGAVVMPMVQAPDTMLRAAVLSILAAVGTAIYHLARIGAVTGEQMSGIINALNGPYTDVVGAMMLNGIIWTLYAMLGGAIVGLASQVPNQVLKGGLLGLVLGAAVGALLRVVLVEFNIVLGPLLFRIAVAAVTWGLFTSVVGGKD